jgi:hypothetical protein
VKKAPTIVFTASLWTLEGYPSPRREWSLARKVQEITAARFDAVEGTARPGLRDAIEHSGLRYSGLFAAEDSLTFGKLLRDQAAIGAERVTVQIRPATKSPARALAKIRRLMRLADQLGLSAGIETHRGTITEAPEAIISLADAYQQAEGRPLSLVWDPSHPAMVRHLKPFQFSDVLLQRPDLVQNATMVHCRPFNGQHAQIPVWDHNSRLTREFREWLAFMEDFFVCWLAGQRPNNELWICPEIGPVGIHGYNLSTMPPSWPQAIACQQQLSRLWRRLVKKAS